MSWNITLAHKVGDVIEYLAYGGGVYSGRVYKIRVSITEETAFIDYYVMDSNGKRHIITKRFK